MKEDKNETRWDKLLQIRTMGRDDSNGVTMELANAEDFIVPEIVDRIYFFNPFSVEILQKVISKILDSYYEKMRSIQLFFYYPSDEYISYLMTVDELVFSDEIDCRDLFRGNDSRERIVIFGLINV